MKKPLRYVTRFAALAAPGMVAWLVRLYLVRNPAAAEAWFSRGLFHLISRPIAFLTGLVPISLTEVLVILAIPASLTLCALLVLAFIRRKGRRLALLGTVSLFLVASISFGYAGFLLLHGYNYLREPLSVSTGLVVRDHSTAELEKVAEDLLARCIQTRAGCAEDSRGVMKLPQGALTTFDTLWEGVDAVSRFYPVISGPRIRPKPVLLSHEWSYTGIVGMYFPYFVEANVNVDEPASSIPSAAAHEMAHALGFAREDEANFISYLICTHHPSVEVRYSGYLLAFTTCYGALAGRDADAAARIAAGIPASMRRDFAASDAYWKQFEGPVRQISENTNNTYLKANDQKDGVYSYGRMVDLVLAYYDAGGNGT